MGVSPGRGRVLDCRRRTSRQLGPDCCRVRRPLREPFGSDLVERRGEGRFPVLIVAEGRHGDQRLRRFRADSLAMLDALRERAQRPLHGRDRQTNLLEIVDRQHPWLRGVAQVGEILDVAGDTLQRQIRLRLPRSDSVDLDTPIARRREEVDGPGDAPALPRGKQSFRGRRLQRDPAGPGRFRQHHPRGSFGDAPVCDQIARAHPVALDQRGIAGSKHRRPLKSRAGRFKSPCAEVRRSSGVLRRRDARGSGLRGSGRRRRRFSSRGAGAG